MARQVVSSYTYDPRTRKVTLGQDVPLAQITSIRNTTRGTTLYLASDIRNASMSGRELTLPNANVAGSATDVLVINYDPTFTAGGASGATPALTEIPARPGVFAIGSIR